MDAARMYVPVITVRGKFLENGSLDRVRPDGQFELIGVLQVLGIGRDEGCRSDITDADTT
jgi:hypothetical protein